jgi:hypothetical protein
LAIVPGVDSREFDIAAAAIVIPDASAISLFQENIVAVWENDLVHWILIA